RWTAPTMRRDSARRPGPGTYRPSPSSSPTIGDTPASRSPAGCRFVASLSAATGPAGSRRNSGRGPFPSPGGPRPWDPPPACPPRGWLASANNRPVSDDYPYHLAGTWSDDLRARRIRHRIEAAPRHAREDVMSLHYDTRSMRAQALVPRLVAVLIDPESWPDGAGEEPRVVQALAALREWDLRVEP